MASQFDSYLVVLSILLNYTYNKTYLPDWWKEEFTKNSLTFCQKRSVESVFLPSSISLSGSLSLVSLTLGSAGELRSLSLSLALSCDLAVSVSGGTHFCSFSGFFSVFSG